LSEVEQVTVEEATAPEAPPMASVGVQLRRAREEAKLSLDAAAQAVKFSTRQIEALEADDYAALPGRTIVRGFVRSYARLLKLDAEALLRELETLMPSGPIEVRPPDDYGVAHQPGDTRKLSLLMAFALVLVLASALLALWHFFGPSVSSPTTTLVGGQQQEVTVPPPLPPDGSISAPSAALQTPAPGPAEPALPALHFVFADRSWLEVTDANKQLLHSSENQAGSQLSLDGRPPFEIVIGNAGKVTLSYRGQPVDLTPYMRADVARLKLE
jgi:cytoskeleton protein RodZ